MTHRQSFIAQLFEKIFLKDYVLLKFDKNALSDLDDQTDLDILINQGDQAHYISRIKNQEHVFKVRVNAKSSLCHIYIFFKDSSFLQIDLLYGFYRKSLEYLNKSEVHEHAVRNFEKINICANHHLLEHVFLFQILNGAGLPKKYISFFEKLPPAEHQRLLNYLNNKYHLSIESIADLLRFNPVYAGRVKAVLSIQKENTGLARIQNAIQYWKDVFRGIKNKQGFTITFSGVDGAGKSTILQSTKNILENKYRRNVKVLRHRPSLLPILSAYRHGKKKAETIAASTLPRQGKNKNTLSSFLRFSYYYLDYLFGQFYIKIKYHWRGYVVLYDRYYFDFIVDSRRSNINLPARVPKFFYRFIYQAPLNLFLYADAATILQRKQELDPESIHELTENYKNLFHQFSKSKEDTQKYISLENIEQSKTLETIIDQYVEMI